jgi:beta-glucosidase
MGTMVTITISVFADPLIEAVKSGAVPESIVDEKVANVLRVMIQTNVLDPKKRFNKAKHEYPRTSASRLSVGRRIHCSS